MAYVFLGIAGVIVAPDLPRISWARPENRFEISMFKHDEARLKYFNGSLSENLRIDPVRSKSAVWVVNMGAVSLLRKKGDFPEKAALRLLLQPPWLVISYIHDFE